MSAWLEKLVWFLYFSLFICLLVVKSNSTKLIWSAYSFKKKSLICRGHSSRDYRDAGHEVTADLSRQWLHKDSLHQTFIGNRWDVDLALRASRVLKRQATTICNNSRGLDLLHCNPGSVTLECRVLFSKRQMNWMPLLVTDKPGSWTAYSISWLLLYCLPVGHLVQDRRLQWLSFIKPSSSVYLSDRD